MTVSNQTNRTSAVGTGAEQIVPFLFPITANSDIVVTSRVTSTGVETTMTETTDYTVTNNGESGGSITTVTPFIASTSQIHIVRDTPNTQILDLEQGGNFNAENVEDAFDKNAKLTIENVDGLERTLVFPTTDPTSSFADMPNSIDRASKQLGFDSAGKPTAIEAVPTGSVAFSTIGKNIAEAADAEAERAILELDTTDDVEFAEVTGTIGTFGEITDVVPKGPYVDVRAYGAIADSGTTNNVAAFNLAIATGKNVYIPYVDREYYEIEDEITLANENQIVFSDGGEVRQATASKKGFIITASDVEIHGLIITGLQASASDVAEYGISVAGADASNFLSGIKVTNCKINTFGFYGIWLEYVEDFDISHNLVDQIWHAGILGVSCRRGTITSNIVTDIVGTGTPHYGIVFSRNTGDSLVTEPRSSELAICNNVVRNVDKWEGIDVHSGENVTISGNTVEGCQRGITVTSTEGSVVGTLKYASLNVSVVGNTVDSGVIDGSAGIGIIQAGAANLLATAIVEYGTGCIVGNSVKGYGTETDIESGGIQIQATEGMAVTGNSIINPSPTGIHIRYLNDGFNVSGNSIMDSWSNTRNATGVHVDGLSAVGYVGGNTFRKFADFSTGGNWMNMGILVQNDTGNQVDIGPNNSEAASYINDDGQKSLRGTIATNANTVDGDETTIALTNIIGNSIGIGRFIKIKAAGFISTATDTKIIKFYFGDNTSITVQPLDNLPNASTWKFDAIIEYSAAGSQRISWSMISETAATANVYQGYELAIEDMTADVEMKMTGKCTNALDTITQSMWAIEKY